ncbi:MAG: GNAT family N-acetyltransferase [Chloroflexota bacterium]
MAIPLRPLLCRPVLPADKAQALAFLRWIWEGDDYLPQVWDSWVADPTALFVAAEQNGRVVGLGRLTDLGEGEAWLEGLRVDPEFLGRGIASHIHDFLLERWASTPSTIIRLATDSTREPVHRLCHRTGFERVANLIEVAAPAAPGPHAFSELAPQDVVRLFEGWAATPLGRSLHGLVELHWQWARATPRRLSALAARGSAWSWDGGRGAVVGTRQAVEDGETLRLQAVAVDDQEVTPFLQDTRRLAAELSLKDVRWKAPAGEPWDPLLPQAGFETEWEMTLVVFEKRR